VSRYQKGKTSLDFTEARDSEWQWHQLGHMQVCTSLQTGYHASTPPLSFFTGRMPFLPPNQQRQSTEGTDLPNQEKKFSLTVTGSSNSSSSLCNLLILMSCANRFLLKIVRRLNMFSVAKYGLKASVS